MKISVYTILYYDTQFLETIYKHIEKYIDEFVIVDGPYSYAIETLKKYNLFYDENSRPAELLSLIERFPKIKYHYKIFQKEEEKRMYGYNNCKNDYVLLVDTDEFINLNLDNILYFMKNRKQKYVSSSEIYNMCDYNINFNKLSRKNIIFKKKKISALQHLDYLWLINCKQSTPVTSYIEETKPIGIMYHLTLNRSKKNTIVKFMFYISLYFHIHNKEFQLLDNYDDETVMKLLSIDELLNIFVHSRISHINLPDNKPGNLLEETTIPNNLQLEKFKDNKKEFYFTNEIKGLVNLPLFFYIERNSKNIKLVIQNGKKIIINLYYYFIGKNTKIVKKGLFESLNNNFIIEERDIENPIYKVIEIRVIETCNEDKIFTLKNIICNEVE